MKTTRFPLLAIIATTFLSTVCHAGVSAVVIIFQPIMTGGEATVIESPKGFTIMPIPFECFHYHGKPPFSAIAQPNPILTSAPRSVQSNDFNLISAAGITIDSSIDDDVVYLHLESFQPPGGFEILEDDVAEAALECIRRTAQNAPKRPILRIRGKDPDKRKWLRWEEHFNKHDFTTPFKRPDA
jgi:hypothetical protein